MEKRDTALGLGLVAAVAVCCGAKLLILLGLPALALLSGHAALAGVAAVAALALFGMLVWRRAGGAGGGCTTPSAAPVDRSWSEDAEPAEAPAGRQPVAAGKAGSIPVQGAD